MKMMWRNRRLTASCYLALRVPGRPKLYLHAIEKSACKVGVERWGWFAEIALTPQLVNRFRALFGDDVALLHSGLAEGLRHRMWTRLRMESYEWRLAPARHYRPRWTSLPHRGGRGARQFLQTRRRGAL